MFDLGFSELLMTFVVALVVLGPKRLPPLVAKVGRWVGKARAMARQFREQLEQEVNLAELNEINEKRAKEARAQAAAAPPAPETPNPPPATSTAMQDSGYPYAPAPHGDAPKPGDDTYSHAHAAGEAPMPYEPEATHPAPPAAPAQSELPLAPAAPAAAEPATSPDKDTARVASVPPHE